MLNLILMLLAHKWVYTFGNGAAEGRADMRNLLGGKGANLAEMNLVGLPVPAGFTVTTDVCTYYYENGQTYPSDLMDQVKSGIALISLWIYLLILLSIHYSITCSYSELFGNVIYVFHMQYADNNKNCYKNSIKFSCVVYK